MHKEGRRDKSVDHPRFCMSQEVFGPAEELGLSDEFYFSSGSDHLGIGSDGDRLGEEDEKPDDPTPDSLRNGGETRNECARIESDM